MKVPLVPFQVERVIVRASGLDVASAELLASQHMWWLCVVCVCVCFLLNAGLPGPQSQTYITRRPFAAFPFKHTYVRMYVCMYVRTYIHTGVHTYTLLLIRKLFHS